MFRHVASRVSLAGIRYKSLIATTSGPLPSWATCDPYTMGPDAPAIAQNLGNGVWHDAAATKDIIDPLTGEVFCKVPDTKPDELGPFEEAAKRATKSGMHNPIKDPQLYKFWGDICTDVARKMAEPETEAFFAKLIQRVVPKSDAQCIAEVQTSRKWLEYVGGDQARMMARSFGVPGDHNGQETRGYRFPYGNVAVVTPFNFPLEICALQSVSALMVGNRPMVKVDEKVSIVCEQFYRLMIECGMPPTAADVLHGDGLTCNELMLRTMPRMTLFTGSQQVADKLTADMKGRVKLEDAGFDWKILGPDVASEDYVAWQCDQDAYALSGQKCSAQSMLFAHKNWMDAGIVDKMADRAAMRKLSDLTHSPVLTWSNADIAAHQEAILKIPGSKLLFGGKPLEEEHSIPDCYGSYEATAVFVPIEEASKPENFEVVTHELFGPFQVVTEYDDSQLDLVLEMCERMENHLTAAIVSNDPKFGQKVLGSTINGTTYIGIRARCTGAPQQHWFGPAGDPRAGGIHTVEAIQQTWTCHREIIVDTLVPDDWEAPHCT